MKAAVKILMEDEKYARRKNLCFKKGQYWDEQVKLSDWIRRRLQTWNLEMGFTIEKKADVKVVKFHKNKSRNGIWYRREHIWDEGQFTVDEDLSE